MFRTLIALLICLLIQPICNRVYSQVMIANDSTDFLVVDGLSAKEKGNTELAFDKLLEAFSELYSDNQHNPKVGFSLIELITQEHKEDYLDDIEKIYFWSLGGDSINLWRETYEEELKRLEPLLERSTFQEWETKLKRDDIAVLDDMKGFWIQRDLSPTQAGNERLIEHWQRIAYAREHFTKNEESPYRTDDRGTIYVKYGEPDLIKSNKLDVGLLKARYWIEQYGENLYFNLTNRHPGIGELRRIERIAKESSYNVQRYASHSEYESWVYSRLGGSGRESQLFLFGDKSGKSFGLVNSLEELVPDDANSMIQSDPGDAWRINKSAVISMLYYEQLIGIHPFFEEGFFETKKYFQKSALGMNFGTIQELSAKNAAKMQLMHGRANLEESSLEKRLSEIPFYFKEFRMLNESNKPEFLLLAFSQPKDALLLDWAKNGGRGFEDFHFKHTLRFFDNSWNEVDQIPDFRPVHGDRYSFSKESVHSQSEFKITHQSYLESNHFGLSSELFRKRDKISTDQTDDLLPENLVGMNKVFIPLPEPLSADSRTLEMSDLILGFESGQNVLEGPVIPFRVHPENKIPEGENLMIHFEVYHIKPNQGGISNYSFTYEIQKFNILGKAKNRDSNLSLTLNYSVEGTQDRRNLEIKTAGLPGDRYRMMVTITDVSTNMEIQREIDFEVMALE